MRSFKKLGLVAALMMSASAAYAVPSGTTVTNTISLSYSSGGATISDPAAATSTFNVDRKIDLVVTGLNGGRVTAERGEDGVNLSYSVQNLGNDPQGYDIDIADSGALGLTYDATGAGGEGTWYAVISNDPTPGVGTETVYDIAGTNSIGDIAADDTFYVHIYANIDETVTDLDERDFVLTATTLDEGTSTVTTEVRGQGLTGLNIVFADPNTDGLESAEQDILIEAPELSATKSVTVLSENLDGTFVCASGGADPAAEATIPGACVEYSISVTNATGASVAAQDIEIVDDFPADMTFVSVDAGTFDTATRDAGTGAITGSIALLAPGVTATFTIRATVGN